MSNCGTKVYVPGIAYSDGRCRNPRYPTLWTVILYDRDGGEFKECKFRKSGATREEARSPQPYAGLMRIIDDLPEDNDIFVLLFDCPTCGHVSELALPQPVGRCEGCGSLWSIENAVAEMAIEDEPWERATAALRARMHELADHLNMAIGKSLF